MLTSIKKLLKFITAYVPVVPLCYLIIVGIINSKPSNLELIFVIMSLFALSTQYQNQILEWQNFQVPNFLGNNMLTTFKKIYYYFLRKFIEIFNYMDQIVYICISYIIYSKLEIIYRNTQLDASSNILVRALYILSIPMYYLILTLIFVKMNFVLFYRASLKYNFFYKSSFMFCLTSYCKQKLIEILEIQNSVAFISQFINKIDAICQKIIDRHAILNITSPAFNYNSQTTFGKITGISPEQFENIAPLNCFAKNQSLPLLKYTDTIKNEVECSVCSELIYPAQLHRTLKMCGHSFHPHCIALWLVEGNRNNCPNCRVIVISDDDISNNVPSE